VDVSTPNFARFHRSKARHLVLLTTAASLALAGCDGGYNGARGRGDAPVGRSDDTPAEVINFPDRFGNVATKCDGHGHRLYVMTHGKTDPPVTVIEDATCGKAAA
jgi:hypothetical protein